MCGAVKGLVGHIHKSSEKIRYLKPVVFHSIIHEQGFYRKYLNLSCAIETQVPTVYFS